MEQGDWDAEPTVAHVCWSDAEADIVVACLRSRGVTAMTRSRVAHSVYPMIADGLGEVQVLVPADQAEEARRVLAEHRDALFGENEEDGRMTE